MSKLNENLNEEMVFILEKQDSILEARKTESNEYILEGIAAVFGKENNNNRIYEEREYTPHLGYLKEKIDKKRLLGELDHPEKFDISLKNISHIITELNHDTTSNLLRIKVKLLDTPAGKIARSLVEAGIPISISSRAAGSVGPDKKVSIKKIFTYDLVADPGFNDAQLERVYESYGYTEDSDKRKSVLDNLDCLNESFGLKENSNTKIYKVKDNDEFEKLINISSNNKNKTVHMNEGKNEFVTSKEINEYSEHIMKEMNKIKESLEEVKEQKNVLKESDCSENANEKLEERIAKLERYSKYLAENLDNSIRYGEYLAENLDDSIHYSKYLAENVDKNISYSKYLAENVDKGISYAEYIAEKTDNTIEYTKYLAENLDNNIKYSEYLGENLDNNIKYSEYLGENLDNNIKYSEYLGENLDKSIEYSEYLSENINTGFKYSEYLAEKLNKNISYSEYLAENINNKTSLDSFNKDNIINTAKKNLNESGFSGNYDLLDDKIDRILESVKTQKTTNSIINEGMKNTEANTQKANGDFVLESENNESGFKFIDEMPKEYKEKWEALTEGQKSSIIAQSNFYNLDTPYQIKNFWSTRQFGSTPIGVQKLNENEIIAENQNNSSIKAYDTSYVENIGKLFEQKFSKKKN